MLFSRKAGSLADRYGARWFLVAGPALVGVGFLLLGQVQRTAGFTSYWYTYLPGVLVFGAGMALTVAPLTTTVMSAIEENMAGTASGINNAVSRMAGVLSIAILGSMAVAAFSQELHSGAATLLLDASTEQAVLAQANQLGGATVPEQVPDAQREPIQQLLDASFLKAYTLVMHLCVALALLASVVAAFFISSKR
ncbi:hypothetical protein GCM10028895_37390 [Pontibacter rugosus]